MACAKQQFPEKTAIIPGRNQFDARFSRENV
jgi:hypothetical protein